MLNGSVTVGPDETVAWFEWGTDTNYGNIAGATIVPGNNGSNNISAPLSGLPGNVYHYRLDAANDFGIVYGEDQLFTVGFAPSATTLPPTNGANGATLEAAVNPEGWDTTVYFQWETPTLTNTTPGIDIGAGAASVNVSSFVPGLSASTPYQYQVVASNALGTAFGVVAYGTRDQHHYLFSGSKTNITLKPGTYIITAYGAPGGDVYGKGIRRPRRLGAEMSAEFNFSTSTTLTLLVGGGGVTPTPMRRRRRRRQLRCRKQHTAGHRRRRRRRQPSPSSMTSTSTSAGGIGIGGSGAYGDGGGGGGNGGSGGGDGGGGGWLHGGGGGGGFLGYGGGGYGGGGGGGGYAAAVVVAAIAAAAAAAGTDYYGGGYGVNGVWRRRRRLNH